MVILKYKKKIKKIQCPTKYVKTEGQWKEKTTRQGTHQALNGCHVSERDDRSVRCIIDRFFFYKVPLTREPLSAILSISLFLRWPNQTPHWSFSAALRASSAYLYFWSIWSAQGHRYSVRVRCFLDLSLFYFVLIFIFGWTRRGSCVFVVGCWCIFSSFLNVPSFLLLFFFSWKICESVWIFLFRFERNSGNHTKEMVLGGFFFFSAFWLGSCCRVFVRPLVKPNFFRGWGKWLVQWSDFMANTFSSSCRWGYLFTW